MCVIIHKPKNKVLKESILQKCWEKNPDGAGLMFSMNNTLTVLKGIMSFNEFIKTYNNYKSINNDIVIHFRKASCGTICPEQTHPFKIDDTLAFVHNGHILNTSKLEFDYDTELVSDTIIFNETVLKKLPPKFLKNEGIISLLNEYLIGSILVFLDNKGNIYKIGDILLNEFLHDEIWFSNDSWNRSNVENLSELKCRFCDMKIDIVFDEYWAVECKNCGFIGPMADSKIDAEIKYLRGVYATFENS